MKQVATLEYTKNRRIGAGQGMNSVVYHATDPQLGGDVAVKEIPLASFLNSVPAFFAEAQCMFAASHANVVPVHYAGTTATDICIAMPYYARGSLQTLIDSQFPPLLDAVRIVQEVLAGLSQVHRKGYVHLDVKPSNVLFDDKGVARIADFGQSRQVNSTGVVSALPPMYSHCIPPEAFKTQVVDVTADVFQVGLLLYRLVNGQSDWENQLATITDLRRAIERGLFPARAQFLPHVPDRLRRVIRKALNVKPAKRFQSATEFADALGKVDVRLNWQYQAQPLVARSWRLIRDGQPDLVVREIHRSGVNDVEVHTDGVQRRARGRAELWRCGLSDTESGAHLALVFKRLA